MDPRPLVSEAVAKELRARGKVDGKDFLIVKHCIGKLHNLCLVCLRPIKRRDQRCQ